MASDNPMGNVTPFYGETWVGGEMVTYVYDSLFLRSPELKLLPGLATGYEVSEDGLTYTVHLREGVTWHDGEPFDADDVVSSYRWMAGMGGTRGASLRGILTETIEAVSPTAVEFHLEETNPFFVDRALTVEVIPEHVWGEIFEDPDPEADVYQLAHDFEAKIGTGPFKFVEMERDQTYRFERNEDYWGPQPQVDELVVTVIKDRSVMMQALSAGEVDMLVISVEPSAAETFEEDEEIALLRGPEMANYSLFFNADQPPFDEVALRRAIARAIDVDKLVELITLGTGTKLTAGYPHPDLWWAPVGLYHAYDPQAANEMLDEAGYERGDDGVRVTPEGEEMAYTLICDANSPTEVRTAELVQGMLEEIGIQVQPAAMDIESGVEKVWPEYSAANGRDYDMAIWLWSNYPMLNRWATPMLFDPRFETVGWANISGYVNPDVEPLVDTFLTTVDPEAQREAELRLYNIVAEDVPFIPLFAPGGIFAFRTEKYDGYQVKLGVGIHNRWTYLPASAWQEPEPVAAGEIVDQAPPLAEGEAAPKPEAPTTQEGPNFLLPVAIVLGVIAAAAAAFFLLRREA
jgi:peptide/nickel transport system substrate-binding protein